MIEAIIDECMSLDLEELKNKSEPKKKKIKTLAKKSCEQKINQQQYKQSINPSKRHRDRLNCELDNLAKLLPFSEDIIARLDKLSILRLSVSYLRNKNFFKATAKHSKPKCSSDIKTPSKDNHFDYLVNEAFDGFILVVTLNGEIFFASERVKDHLGYSQSQVLHQPLETLVHDDDREDLMVHIRGSSGKIAELKEGDDGTEKEEEDFDGQTRDFVVRLKSVMNTSSSDMYKPYRISGTIRSLHIEPEVDNLKYALFAFCTPARTSHSLLEIRIKSTLFCSKNRIDLSFLDLDARGKDIFGYTKKDIFGRSSYVLVHRFDLRHLRCKHTEIMTCGKSSIGTFRLMGKNHEWLWVCGYGRLVYKNGKPDYVVTTNRIMSAKEGNAMLKFRDEVDYKAITQLGLIEPEDPAKAMELGFPEHPSTRTEDMSNADAEPIPMMLSEYFGHDLPGLMQPSAQSKNESLDLLKGPLFDIGDNQERYWSGDNTFPHYAQGSYPSCEASTDSFQPTMSCQSPTGSNISGHTHRTHESLHSNSSHGNDQVAFENKTEPGFQSLSPNFNISSVYQQQPLHHSLPSKPSDISTPSCSATRPSAPQLAHMPENSLFDHLSNLDMVQQQLQSSHNRGQQSMRFPFAQNPSQVNNSDEYYQRQQQKLANGQYANSDYNGIRTQCDSFENRMPYDQVGPNVAVTTPNYELTNPIHGIFDYSGHRNQINSERPYGYTSIGDNQNNLQSSNIRPQVNLHAQAHTFQYQLVENSPFSPPQQFIPSMPYRWTQM